MQLSSLLGSASGVSVPPRPLDPGRYRMQASHKQSQNRVKKERGERAEHGWSKTRVPGPPREVAHQLRPGQAGRGGGVPDAKTQDAESHPFVPP